MKANDIFIGLAVVLLWSFNFIAIKMGLSEMPPFLLASVRLMLAAFPAICFFRRPKIKFYYLLSLGLSLYVGQFAFLFLGLKLSMPSGLTALILQAQVLFTFLFSYLFLNQQCSWKHIWGLGLATIGIVAIGYKFEGELTAVGFALIITAASCWGMGNVILHKISTVSPDVSMLALIVWASAISALPMLILSWFLEGPAQWQTALHTFNVNTMLSLIYLAYFVTLAGYALWGKLLSTGTPSVSASFALLVPLVNLGCSAVYMGESVTVLQIFGSVMVMVGLVINTFGEQLAMLFLELDKEEVD